jgi:hypothetical protein
MILFTDIIGVLIVVALAFQGYKDSIALSRSLTIPELLSVTIFYKIFPHIYTFFLLYIPYTVITGLITILLINLSLITIFHKLLTFIMVRIQEKFFLPQFSSYTKKIAGIILGMLTGYIFITGAVTALEQHLSYQHQNSDALKQSIFFKISHKPSQNIIIENKIDNLPSLRELYSETNVVKFNFTEEELIAILKMIRAASNKNAQELLKQIHDKQDITNIYHNLIEMYLSQEKVAEKYLISEDILEQVKQKTYFRRENQVDSKTTKQDNIKSISDIIDMI